MAFERFKKKKTVDELEEERDRLVIEEEVVSKQADIAERKAVIAELKKQYGPNWARTLGISKLTDLSTLRSFLKGAKKGLEGQASGSNSMRSLMSFGKVKRA